MMSRALVALLLGLALSLAGCAVTTGNVQCECAEPEPSVIAHVVDAMGAPVAQPSFATAGGSITARCGDPADGGITAGSCIDWQLFVVGSTMLTVSAPGFTSRTGLVDPGVRYGCCGPRADHTVDVTITLQRP